MRGQKRDSLREARKAKGLTQLELAQLVGVTLEHIKSLEYGRVNPSTQLMFKICNALGSTPQNLFADVVCA
ncbi:helix-turn-helix transcriptional regulator [Cohnella luojiensis]|uniref:XRE family transcriptional regulator n=1 Tax=Cohnella luojiensis TaxID=652876 RepID=A0A4Y8M556_9BACL|nr:helix-turn-helix transcriptional regulator [Cohnella luojiensis]TFE30806.1 XRE family transcriptional regulator [Cohnella luojiensis]